MGTTSSIGSLYFTGISQYSSDFQSILTRAQQIAQLPITALQNQQTDNQNKSQALDTLDPVVADVGSAVASLGTLAANGGLAASSSNTNLVSAVTTGTAAAGSYTITNIRSLASAASEMSLTGYANTSTSPVSASGVVNLVAGSQTYQLNISQNNNLAGLVNAINNSGANVTASILTTGTGATPDYLVVTANSTGATTLQLNDLTSPSDLMTSTGTGTETSLTTYADPASTPVSSSGYVNLVVGSKTYNLNISANNNLNGVAQAINNAGAGVTATVSNGSLSISTNNSSATTIQLNDMTPTNLISSTNQGSNADFFLNNIEVTRSSNAINDVISGVSLTLNGTTSTSYPSATISVSTDASQLSNALQTLVTNYNSLVDQVNQQRGQSGGVLVGDSIIWQISNDMQQLATYWNPSSSSSIHSLSDLGVEFDDTGKMSFNQNTFNNLSQTQISDAFNFLGSSTSGLAALANNFTQITDPIEGLIQMQLTDYQNQDTSLSDQIATLTAQATVTQNTLTAKVQAADALCAQLQSEQTDVSAEVQSLNYVMYGYQQTPTGGT
ncbi:MAG TPA: flagellar filament capping protein FliD [Bryobacteraceae bacterium]|nr:flagellar filament capping protein FliD [Bryobacteraceae bacterium]